MHPAGDSSLPLSLAMREGSRGDHEHAESSDFVADLMAGRANPARYAAPRRTFRSGRNGGAGGARPREKKQPGGGAGKF